MKDLELQWIYQASSLEKFEATSLVVDGILYTVQAPNDIIALDAATGRTFWTYNYNPSPKARPCCGHVNRGLAILGNTLFMGTIDAHLVAVDAKNGHLIWDTTVAKPQSGYALTHAPLVVKDKVIVGTAGGEFGIRGFIAAYDVHTGKEVWRFYTVPGPGEAGHETWGGDSWKTGGASVWVTGSYDPALNLTYWGVGNPGPDWNGDPRPGDNLYSNSVVALDADTGKLKWHYQFSPHDEFDHDSVQIPLLADLEWPDESGQKKMRKLMLWANRNGIFYVLDRSTGKFLLGKPFTEVNWMSGFDEKGRPIRVPGKVPTVEGTAIHPGSEGATNWYSPSYSPRTGTLLCLHLVGLWRPSSFAYLSSTRKAAFMPVDGPSRLFRMDELRRTFARTTKVTASVRAIDPNTGARSLGIQDERRHRCRRSDHRFGSVVQRRAGRIFLCAGCAQWRLALEGDIGWRRRIGSYDLLGGWQAIYFGCRRQFAVRFRPEKIAIASFRTEFLDDFNAMNTSISGLANMVQSD